MTTPDNPLTTYDVKLAMISFLIGSSYRNTETINKKLSDQSVIIQRLYQAVENQGRAVNESTAVMHNIQHEFAKNANNALERHALIPAVIAIVSLVDEIKRIAIVAENCDQMSFDRLCNECRISMKLALEKLDHLDIHIIKPKTNEKFKPVYHRLQNTVTTKVSEDSGKVHSCLSDGILYRQKIIRPAKVLVWKYD